MDRNKLVDLANKYSTPLYVYDADVISEQYNKLTTAFGEKVKFFYACKALSNINILRHIHSLGCNIDCVSINEVKLALKVGFTAHQIIYTPNCVGYDEVVECKELGVHINIDNMSTLEKFGADFGDSYPVCIRINPHIMAGGNMKISTGHIDSKFGISIHQLRHIARVVKSTGLVVNGLHMHTGSEIKDIDVFIRALELLLDIAQDFDDLEFLDLGSGFKVAYKDGEENTDIDLLAKKVHKAMEKSKTNLELWFEPGKFLVSDSGTFITKTNTVKQTTATTFVGINSGFNHLIRPMFYDSYHKIINISASENANKRIYTVVGNLCETDTFAWDRKMQEVREGDYIAFCNAGAYCYEMSSSFNSRFKPAEVMLKDGKDYLIRRRETVEDLQYLQVDLSNIY